MNYRNILIKSVLTVGISVSLAACDSWLDVQPKSQVEDTDLFETESGFKEALSGVYSSMLSESTYSREMTFGTMAILGQEWDHYPSQYAESNSTTPYANFSGYDYSSTVSSNVIAGIWSQSYNGIANVNNLLKHIDGKKAVFQANNYEIIKGEALALRAFLHFDLLRSFGVSYEVNANMPAIPYSTDLSYRVFPQLKVSEVAGKVMADLLEAEKLLEVDPILTGDEITELDDNGYLMNRQLHLNYYAVKGLQARVYMWMKKYSEAEAAARVVINSNAFPWAQLSYISVGHDYGFATEQLFALNNITLSTLSDYYFDVESGYAFSVDFETLLTDYYDNVTTDYRYLYLFAGGVANEAVNYRFSLKYDNPYVSSNEVFDEEAYYSNKMSMIRLSEMFLIAAECQYRANGGGLTELNTIRTARGVPKLETLPTDFYTELIREYRRELLGEGQLFFLYKRLNSSLVFGADVDMVGTKSYTFPLPVSETDAAQREDNR